MQSDNETSRIITKIRVVKLRGLKNKGSLKALADVTIETDAGAVQVNGVVVRSLEGGQLLVLGPSRKGKRDWFKVVVFRGRLVGLVSEAVLAAYQRISKGQ